MAQRRMLSQQVGHSGEYLSLSYQAQSLYTQLWLIADDDGFIKDKTSSCRLSGTGENEIIELIDAGFIYRFDSGVIVIRHWKINNQIQKDRYHPTVFVKEAKQVKEDENRYYYLSDTKSTQNVSTMDTEISIDQSSVVQSSVEQPRGDQGSEGESGGGTTSPFMKVLNYAKNKDIDIHLPWIITRIHDDVEKYGSEKTMNMLDNDSDYRKRLMTHG